MVKAALGKGLGALISARGSVASQSQDVVDRVQRIPLSQIVPSPLQPRLEFRGEHLDELVDSIRERGIIQPLIVRRSGSRYELIAGERRWRAAQQVGLHDAPAIVRQATDLEVLELALIENLQREDLNPIEEATAYARLSHEFGLTQEEIAKRVGKSRASIANAVRLLDLDPDVQSFLKQGRISVGHAKVLLSLKSHEEQRALANTIVRQTASVRTAERLAAQLCSQGNPGGSRKKSKAVAISPHIHHIQNLLQHRLATRVVLHHGEKQGTIVIEYYGADDLQRVLSELGVAAE